MSVNLRYRPDIDGLRAIAVLSVILFHMNPNWLPGGFLGVDIFFVISGFLITTIIHRQITQGTFSFSEFYTRRMKRILPAFFVVVISCIIVGYFLLLPINYNSLGKSAFSTLFFASNIYFARTTGGYFEANDTLPLLHTWSLAVEEQYYFVWPVILILLLKSGIKQTSLIFGLIVVALLSFTGATVMALSDSFLSPWNYYMLPSRAGELLIGSILAILLNNNLQLRSSNRWGVIGSLLILLSFVLINGQSVFPGINAFWVCLGVAFIIFSKPSSIINRALSIRPLKYIGLISYSLYLWHWPILAFMRYVNPNNQVEQSLSNTQLLIAGTLTWFLSHITYKLVECRTKHLKLIFTKTVTFYLVVPSFIVSIFFGIIFFSNGVPSRFGDFAFEQTMHTPRTMCSQSTNRGCLLSLGKGKRDIALVGDSHAESLESFFKLLGQKNNLTIKDYASSSCAPAQPLVNVLSNGLCSKARSMFDKRIEFTDTVILVARWETVLFSTYDNTKKGGPGAIDSYYEMLKIEILNLKSQGISKIILVHQVPKYKQNIGKLLLPLNEVEYEIDELYIHANQKISKLANETEAFVIDFSPVFCKKSSCSPLDENRNILYFDDDHLNVFGAKWLFANYQKTSNYHDFLSYLES